MLEFGFESAKPMDSPVMDILPDWIDYNGHLNMAYYMVLFDQGSDHVFAQLGMGPDYARARKLTTYTAEAHIRYLREIHRSDPVISRLQLIDADTKRLHTFQELVHATEGWVGASCEMITLHVDQAGPRVAPFPDDIFASVQALREAHASLPRPDGCGRAIAMARKAASP